MSFRSKFQRFMYGRNGIDKLTNGLFVLYIILLIGNVFLRSWIIYGGEFLLVALILFRTFSKNIYQRRRESAVFEGVWKKVSTPFTRLKNWIRDRKTHSYRKCPHCKVVLRLPKKKGEHGVVCPKCKNEFRVKI